MACNAFSKDPEENIPQQPIDQAAHYYNSGVNLIAQGSYQAALDAFNAIYNHPGQFEHWLQNQKNRADLYYTRALALLMLGNYQEALAGFNEIYNHQNQFAGWLQDQYNRANLYYNRALTLINLGNYQEALAGFNEIYNHQNQFAGWLQDRNNLVNLMCSRVNALQHVLYESNNNKEPLDSKECKVNQAINYIQGNTNGNKNSHGLIKLD